MKGVNKSLLREKNDESIEKVDHSSRIEMEILNDVEQKNLNLFQGDKKVAAKLNDILKDVGFFSDLEDDKIWTLFQLLIPDWDKMSSDATSYDLLFKSEIVKAKTGKNLFIQITNLLLNQNEKSFFHPFAYEILCQFFGELIAAKNVCVRAMENPSRDEEIKSFLIDVDSADLETFLADFNIDYRPLMRLVMVFCTFSIKDHEKLKKTDDHLELLYCIRMSLISKFKKKLVEMLERDDEKLGSFSRIALQPIMRFFIFIANQQKKKSFVRLILTNFPHLEGDSMQSLRTRTPATIYYDGKSYERKIEEVTEIIKGPKDSYRFESIEKSFEKNLSSKKCQNEIMFGRNLKRPESLFELVLSVPGIKSSDDEKSCLQKICDQLQVSKSPGFLTNVRQFYLLNA